MDVDERTPQASRDQVRHSSHLSELLADRQSLSDEEEPDDEFEDDDVDEDDDDPMDDEDDDDDDNDGEFGQRPKSKKKKSAVVKDRREGVPKKLKKRASRTLGDK